MAAISTETKYFSSRFASNLKLPACLLHVLGILLVQHGCNASHLNFNNLSQEICKESMPTGDLGILIVACNNKCYVGFVVVVVALLFYVHGKHLRSCRDGQLT